MTRKLSAHLLFVLLIGVILAGCENEYTNVHLPERPMVGIDPENRPPGYPRYYSEEAKLRDTVYFRTWEFYLWQDQLPRSFATYEYRTADDMLEALKMYAKRPDGSPYDRFSFLDRSGTINREIQQGQSTGGFGFDVRYLNEEELYLKKVDPGSPAHAAGLRRGWQVLEINGRTNLRLATMEQDDFSFLFDAIYGEAVTMKLRNSNGEEQTVSLQSAPYPLTPILAERVFDMGGKKVGYLAFDMFVSNTLIKSQLAGIMDQFQAAGAKHVIVDLRYNGGGDVMTAVYLSNLLVPHSAQGQRMFRYEINQLLTDNGWGQLVFPPVNFNKENSLALDGVYFLVTGGTASASELLINNLIPHMDVTLIGDGNTYGKPVGYFGWDVMGVDLYAVSFETFNGLDQGSYFDGMPVDQFVADDVTRDFGNPLEGMTAAALQHVVDGSFPISGFSARGAPSRAGFNNELDRKLQRPMHGAMFDFRKINLPLPH